jgi:hypothetical protein
MSIPWRSFVSCADFWDWSPQPEAKTIAEPRASADIIPMKVRVSPRGKSTWVFLSERIDASQARVRPKSLFASEGRIRILCPSSKLNQYTERHHKDRK